MIRINDSCSKYHRLRSLAQNIFIEEQNTIDIRHMGNVKSLVYWTTKINNIIQVSRESIEKLQNVEVAVINEFSACIYSNVLKNCINLEHFSTRGFTGNESLYQEWLSQSYPTVKHLEFDTIFNSVNYLEDLLDRCLTNTFIGNLHTE